MIGFADDQQALPHSASRDPSPRAVAARRGVVLVLAGLLAMSLAACTHAGFTRDEAVVHSHGSATCAFSVSLDDVTYVGTYPPVPVETAERIGTATIPPCNDTGQDYDGPVDTLPAYRVIGLAPSDAIAVRYGPNDQLKLVAASTAAGNPPAVAAYIAERDPNGSILVAPDRDLHDGDIVTVTIRGLDPGTEAMVGQCVPAQGAFACLTRSIGEVPPASPSPSTEPSTTEPDHAPASSTTRSGPGPGPNTVVRLTWSVHDPLTGDLELFDSHGKPMAAHNPPGEVSCHGVEALSCLIAVRGTHNGERVVRYATIRFDTPTPPTSTAG